MRTRFQERPTGEWLAVPFDPTSREALLSGRQTATTRRRAIGAAGTRFLAFGQVFEVVSVAKVLLTTVASCCFRAEGYGSPDAFRLAWAERHPRRGWQPGQLVYHHVIRMVQ